MKLEVKKCPNCGSNEIVVEETREYTQAEFGRLDCDCGECEGEDGIAALVESNALNLMEPLKQSQWAVLTNQSGDSALGEVVTAYQRECTTLNQEQLTNLGEIEIFYWTSFFQYQTYLSLVPAIKERCHCCGFGKSFSQFKNAGVEVTPFISITEFKKTVNL